MSVRSGAVDLYRGVIRGWKKLAWTTVTVFSVLFTIASAVDFFLKDSEMKTKTVFSILALLSFAYGLKTVWKPSKVKIVIANCNTILEIIFADLFAQDGIRAVAVNEYFDSKLGRPVSPNSLHGKLISQCFGGHPQPFDDQLINELAMYPSTIEPLKIDGKLVKYEIGTTAMVSVNNDQYLVFALTHTDPATCKARADVTMLWNAVNALWKRGRTECNDLPLNVPLVGSGPSGLGLPTRDLLNLIVLSAITETKALEVTKIIRIVIHKDRFDDIDLRDVKKHWEEK